MLKSIPAFLLSVALAAPAALADTDEIMVNEEETSTVDDSTTVGEPGAVGTTDGTTVRQVTDDDKGVYDSPVQLTPRLGVVGFSDITGNYTSRAAGGITGQWNVFGHLDESPLANIQLGLETGFIYSHLGAPASGFFGADRDDSPTRTGIGGNAFMIPANIVAGYRIAEAFMISGLVGGNVIYRSQNQSMALGRDDFENDDSAELFPSLGLVAGWEVNETVGISLRGDYIPTPVDDVFTASLGATIPLG